MTVIVFPTRKAQPPVDPEATLDQGSEVDRFMGSGIEAAFEVHRMIFNAMNMEALRDNPGALGSVLLFAMSHHFGPDLVLWAENQFENVYGIDPRGFIEHVTAYRA